MTALAWGFQGQADGQTVTAANSTAGGDPALNAPNIASGASLTYTAETACHGDRALRLQGASNGFCYIEAPGLSGGQLSTSLYLLLTAAPSTNTTVLGHRTSSSESAAVQILTDRTLRVLRAGGNVVAVTTALFPIGQWARIDFSSLASTTAGETHLALHLDPESRTPTEALDATGLNTGSGPLDRIRAGKCANNDWASPFYIDTVRVRDDTVTRWGPYGGPSIRRRRGLTRMG